MTAPIAYSPNRSQHRSYPTDDLYKSYEREETTDDKVGDDNPIDVQARSGEMAVKSFLFIIVLSHKSYLFFSALRMWLEPL